MQNCKLSSSLSLGSWTILLVMDCLVYITAAAALALASKPSLQVDNVFTVLATSLGPGPAHRVNKAFAAVPFV